MDFLMMVQVIAAVIVANAATALFAFGAYAAWRAQKYEHKGDSELPGWIYPAMIFAPALAAFGFYLSPV